MTGSLRNPSEQTGFGAECLFAPGEEGPCPPGGGGGERGSLTTARGARAARAALRRGSEERAVGARRGS